MGDFVSFVTWANEIVYAIIVQLLDKYSERRNRYYCYYHIIYVFKKSKREKLTEREREKKREREREKLVFINRYTISQMCLLKKMYRSGQIVCR